MAYMTSMLTTNNPETDLEKSYEQPFKQSYLSNSRYLLGCLGASMNYHFICLGSLSINTEAVENWFTIKRRSELYKVIIIPFLFMLALLGLTVGFLLYPILMLIDLGLRAIAWMRSLPE